MILQQGDDGTEKHKESLALFGMVAFGCGEVSGGWLVGKFIDRFSSKTTSLLNVFICATMIISTCISINWMEYNWLSYFMCYCWGFQDGAINVHTYSICSYEFKSQSEPFAIFSTLQGLGSFFFSLIQG